MRVSRIILVSSSREKTVILSDDVYIGDFFREQLEKNIDSYEFFTLNRSFAHFVISKNTVRKVGWFEERLPRIGWEDTDYQFRLKMAGIAEPNIKVLGSLNLHTDTDGSDWVNDPAKPKTKYTYANEDFFKTKWLTKHYNPEVKEFKYVGIDAYHTFSPANNEGTPLFYDLSILDVEADSNKLYSGNKKSFNYYFQKTAFTLSDKIFTFLRKTKRFFKKALQAKPPI